MFNVLCSAGQDCAASTLPFLAVPFIILFIIIFSLVFFLPVVLLKLFLWWRIFSKAGFSGAFAFLLLVPLGELILLLMLAFSNWQIKSSEQKI